MSKPLCFVLMPFGRKRDGSGLEIDFDAVYAQLIAPAIAQAGMEPLRADQEQTGGIIQKPMFERLILCEYAIADLTTANANVFYELGVRHANRPWSTVLLYGGQSRLPFDVADLRATPYDIGPEGLPGQPEKDQGTISKRLIEARKGQKDSPLFQLLENYPEIRHEKTDVFRNQVEIAQQWKDRLREARAQQERQQALDAFQAIEQELEPIQNQDSSVLVDLLLSYRAKEGWKEMIALAGKMPPILAHTVLVREQLALALNRDKKSEQAEEILLRLIKERGSSSETYGLLGRVYKDRWQRAKKNGNEALARGCLEKATDAYLKGFEADWRDTYPGINAATMMELAEQPDERRKKILPVVVYSAERHMQSTRPDYWDYATCMEANFLEGDQKAARDYLGKALAALPPGEAWVPKTTLNNLDMIIEARRRRGELESWMEEIREVLTRAAFTDGKGGMRNV
jgi:tetratricopeptide (TPR) repeat protein